MNTTQNSRIKIIEDTGMSNLNDSLTEFCNSSNKEIISLHYQVVNPSQGWPVYSVLIHYREITDALPSYGELEERY